jgi:hypothetical protein
MPRSVISMNGHKRVTTNRDNIRHLEYFLNGQWRHSYDCKKFTNTGCTMTQQVFTNSI